MVENNLSLKGNYPTINGSYGGNQEWFRDDVFSDGDLIRYGGCGLIAMADTLLYLASQKQLGDSLPNLVKVNHLTEPTYKMFVESLYFRYLQPWRNPFFNPNNFQNEASFVLGIQGWQLRRGFNRFFQQKQTRFYSTKGKGDLDRLIQQQLKKNRPVPLMIGPVSEMFPRGLRFLGRQEASLAYPISRLEHEFPSRDMRAVPTRMSAHWVTITGYYQEKSRSYVVISSWGERYLLDLTAYLEDADWIGGVIII